MRRFRILLALSGLAASLAGCVPEKEVFLQDPVTGDTVTCNSNYGRSSFLLTQFTGDHSATRHCVETNQANGLLRLN